MSLPLPAALKRRLRATPQWLAISLPAPQRIIDVKLLTAAGEFDVTDNNAVAALRPLTLRLGLDARLAEALRGPSTPQMHFVDHQLGRSIGVLRLNHLRNWETSDARIGLFEVARSDHDCAHRLRKSWDSWRYRRGARHTPADKQLMTPAAVEQLMVFSLCPRPVFFVGVDDGEHSNIFPMDLVGPMLPERFTLALRNTSPSVETMKRSRRVVLGDVPGSASQIAYQLGAHHRKSNIDTDALPFKVLRSRLFSLPAPALALRAREVEIMDFQSIGSHTLFVGRICSEEPLAAGEQLFHTCGIHQRLRMRHGRAFHEA